MAKLIRQVVVAFFLLHKTFHLFLNFTELPINKCMLHAEGKSTKEKSGKSKITYSLVLEEDRLDLCPEVWELEPDGCAEPA